MKRFLTAIFILLALVVSAAGATPAARADCIPGTANCDPCPTGPDNAACLANAKVSIQSAAAGGINIDPAAAGIKTDYKPEYSFNGIMAYIAQLFAWLLGVAAITLDNAVYYTVVNMGTFVNKLSAVGVTWRILRDIGNILLIFGFLGVGITTILSVEWFGVSKKMLPMMFVAAVFLNFSLFFAEAIVDTGNLFATQFYTQINGDNPAGAKTFGLSSINQEGISNKIMSQLGLQTIYGEVQDPKKAADLLKNSWTIGFMSIILFMVAAFVMFSLAFILIFRFVALIFLIIVSPIGFAGLAIPGFAARAKQWWTMLFEQTITAPILLLMLYIALAVITDVSFLTGFSDCVAGAASNVANSCSNPSYVGFTNNNFNGFASVILSFLVAMGLLIMVIIYSKRWSAAGGTMATNIASKLSGVSIAAAAPGWVGRYTAGLGANYAAKKLRGTAFGRSFVGRGFADTLEKRVAGASFDIRNTGLGKQAAGIGLDLGKGQKGGYKADLEERVKSYERAAAGITGDSAKGKEEKDAAKQAKMNLNAATEALDKVKAEHGKVEPALAQENTRQKAEVDRLKAEKERAGIGTFAANEIDKKLIPAQESLAKSDVALKAANDKLKNAKDALTSATNNETAASKLVGTAKKKAQNEYADRLGNKWGPVWVFGTAAAAAAPRVRSDIGKSRTEREIKALLDKIKENTGETDEMKKEEREEKKAEKEEKK